MQVGQKTVVLLAGFMGWIVLVEYVTSEKQVVGFFLSNLAEQEIKEKLHVCTEVFLVQAFAQVPIG
jgi:hypothetical protein